MDSADNKRLVVRFYEEVGLGPWERRVRRRGLCRRLRAARSPPDARGSRADCSGVNIFRFGDDGKVAEIWNHRDDLGLMEQLGAAAFAGAPGDDPR